MDLRKENRHQQGDKIFIAGVSNVGPLNAGPWAGRRCIGSSLAVDPKGDVVLQGPYGVDADTIMYIDIKLKRRPARGCGWEYTF